GHDLGLVLPEDNRLGRRERFGETHYSDIRGHGIATRIRGARCPEHPGISHNNGASAFRTREAPGPDSAHEAVSKVRGLQRGLRVAAQAHAAYRSVRLDGEDHSDLPVGPRAAAQFLLVAGLDLILVLPNNRCDLILRKRPSR